MIQGIESWVRRDREETTCDDFSAIELTTDHLKTMYRTMVAARRLDKAAVTWQRQGMLPAYAPCLGQEGAQVGSAFVLDRKRDMAFPTYREMAVARTLGIDMVEYFASAKGVWNGGLYDPNKARLAPFQAVVAGSVLHAVGWAHGARLETETDADLPVALSYFGDGASSQGDVHEAMNFAAVMQAPVVFFCQNNGWAISVPTDAQVAGGSIASRAAGYGMASYRIDGNDAVAVAETTSRALAYARAGRGPVIIEAMTYRLGPHSTSDDPGRYRRLEDEHAARRNDPIERLAQRLLDENGLDDAFFEQVNADAETEEDELRQCIEALPRRPGRELFEHVYQRATPELERQQAQWREETAYDV